MYNTEEEGEKSRKAVRSDSFIADSAEGKVVAAERRKLTASQSPVKSS